MKTVGELAAMRYLIQSGRVSSLRLITLRLIASRSIAAGAMCCALLLAVAAQSQSAPPPPAKSTRVRAKLDGFDIAPTSGKAPNQIGGASRDLGALTLYAPKLAKAYTLTPTFFWSALLAGEPDLCEEGHGREVYLSGRCSRAEAVGDVYLVGAAGE